MALSHYTYKPKIGKIEGRWPFIDKIQVWLADPLTREQLSELRSRCAHVHSRRELMPFHGQWRHRLQLCQPDDDALALLDSFAHGRRMVNYVEVALDLTTASRRDADDLAERLSRTWIKPWRGKQVVARVGNTLYGAQNRRIRNQAVMYADQHSKATGEVYCVHLEWRITGADAVRAVGLSQLRDLIELDFREFWSKRLQLRHIDIGKLGRAFRRTRRRKPWVVEWWPSHVVDMDQRAGMIIARAAQRSGDDDQPARPVMCAQTILDYCKNVNIKQAVIRLENDNFLPG